MSMIKCNECEGEISSAALDCPHCGCRTMRGRSATQNKVLLIKWVACVVAILIGLMLFVGNLETLMELHDDWKHNMFYQNGGFSFRSYLKDDNQLDVWNKTIFGIILMMSGAAGSGVLLRVEGLPRRFW